MYLRWEFDVDSEDIRILSLDYVMNFFFNNEWFLQPSAWNDLSYNLEKIAVPEIEDCSIVNLHN